MEEEKKRNAGKVKSPFIHLYKKRAAKEKDMYIRVPEELPLEDSAARRIPRVP